MLQQLITRSKNVISKSIFRANRSSLLLNNCCQLTESHLRIFSAFVLTWLRWRPRAVAWPVPGAPPHKDGEDRAAAAWWRGGAVDGAWHRLLAYP